MADGESPPAVRSSRGDPSFTNADVSPGTIDALGLQPSSEIHRAVAAFFMGVPQNEWTREQYAEAAGTLKHEALRRLTLLQKLSEELCIAREDLNLQLQVRKRERLLTRPLIAWPERKRPRATHAAGSGFPDGENFQDFHELMECVTRFPLSDVLLAVEAVQSRVERIAAMGLELTRVLSGLRSDIDLAIQNGSLPRSLNVASYMLTTADRGVRELPLEIRQATSDLHTLGALLRVMIHANATRKLMARRGRPRTRPRMSARSSLHPWVEALPGSAAKMKLAGRVISEETAFFLALWAQACNASGRTTRQCIDEIVRHFGRPESKALRSALNTNLSRWKRRFAAEFRDLDFSRWMQIELIVRMHLPNSLEGADESDSPPRS